MQECNCGCRNRVWLETDTDSQGNGRYSIWFERGGKQTLMSGGAVSMSRDELEKFIMELINSLGHR